jgi:pimeloyl-ACP methyl ester carboxylesterase
MARGPAVPTSQRLPSGITLSVLSWPGTSPPIVLLHPNRTNARVWDFVVANSTLDNQVVAVDHRGHGSSDWPDDGYDLQHYVDDDIELIGELFVEPVILVGAATGGNIALLLASQRPELIRAVAVFDPGLSLDPAINARVQDEIDKGHSFPTRQAAVDSMPFSDLWTDHVRAHFGHYAFQEMPDGQVKGRYRKEAAAHTESVLEEDLWDAIALRCPLLAARGARSAVFDRTKLVRLGNMVPGSFLAEVPRSDHRVTQDNPVFCAALLDGFVRALLADE